jgi:CMP/dCMP kinase
LFKAEKEIIEHLAKERSAVIIGRCGSYILRDHPNHFSIFLHGDISFRKGRIKKLYDVSEKAAGNMIARSDKERTLYYRTFTKEEWPDATKYDLSLDASSIGLDKCVEIILKCLD